MSGSVPQNFSAHFIYTVMYLTRQVEPCVNKAIQLLNRLKERLSLQQSVGEGHRHDDGGDHERSTKGGRVSTVMWEDDEGVKRGRGGGFGRVKTPASINESLCIEGTDIFIVKVWIAWGRLQCMYIVHVLMRDEKEGRSKQGQTNNKAKQHSTPKAVTFPKKNELSRVGLEPTTLYTLDRALYR